MPHIVWTLQLHDAKSVCVCVCSHMGPFQKMFLNTQTMSARLTMEQHAHADSPSYESLY